MSDPLRSPASSAGPSAAPCADPRATKPAPWRIDAAALRAALVGPARRWAVETVEETGSTNADLVHACRMAEWPAADGEADGEASGVQVRHTYLQTAGRGRQGRPWQQGQAGLTFSVALPLALPLARLAGLSLAVGLAVAEALDDCMGADSTSPATPVRLKWPNDLQVDGRKLAGILIETVPAGTGRVWAVVGIGINLVRDAATEAALGRALAGVEEVLPGFDVRHDATRVFAAVLNRLAAMREVFVAEGLAPMTARWSARDAFRDEPVRLLQDGRLIAEGLARGVDDEGHLLLETDAGLQRVTSGEVSLRGAQA
ncbi:biotin--[acetyl-CoA-carboxylase] ligase [Cupriavidus pampae]|uniref:biotin--[biotin carboxyl-carrier protein] ligase n=1 Tax=Cupriavidus pampae TaxID=659251 RepID=A0ABM8X6Y6_9BURK|nr:biotin--[acetyl-CoA-carboxylase] ligase [Cupriavidus pampae]CAG9175729.1 Bifunctional ligase/repressor BirA [Cupriavidus pampae]